MRSVNQDFHPLNRLAQHGAVNMRCSYSLGFEPRDICSLNIVGTPLEHDGCVNVLKWKRDGTKIITGSDDKTGM